MYNLERSYRKKPEKVDAKNSSKKLLSQDDATAFMPDESKSNSSVGKQHSSFFDQVSDTVAVATDTSDGKNSDLLRDLIAQDMTVSADDPVKKRKSSSFLHNFFKKKQENEETSLEEAGSEGTTVDTSSDDDYDLLNNISSQQLSEANDDNSKSIHEHSLLVSVKKAVAKHLKTIISVFVALILLILLVMVSFSSSHSKTVSQCSIVTVKIKELQDKYDSEAKRSSRLVSQAKKLSNRRLLSLVDNLNSMVSQSRPDVVSCTVNSGSELSVVQGSLRWYEKSLKDLVKANRRLVRKIREAKAESKKSKLEHLIQSAEETYDKYHDVDETLFNSLKTSIDSAHSVLDKEFTVKEFENCWKDLSDKLAKAQDAVDKKNADDASKQQQAQQQQSQQKTQNQTNSYRFRRHFTPRSTSRHSNNDTSAQHEQSSDDSHSSSSYSGGSSGSNTGNHSSSSSGSTNYGSGGSSGSSYSGGWSVPSPKEQPFPKTDGSL